MELKAEKIYKKYGKRWVVKGVTVSVSPGEIVGLLGPNGAGKTTTFFSLLGLVKPEAGEIFFDAKEITEVPMYQRARLGMGYLPQDPSLFRGLSVQENLLAILERKIFHPEGRQKLTQELLEEFGLWHLKNQKAWSLSGGERRRLEIARALALGPKIILLDEPFVGIDPITVQEIQEMIFRLKQRGLGILITDHNVRETLNVIDRAYLIYEGKILMEGSSQELIENPKARERYLGENFQM